MARLADPASAARAILEAIGDPAHAALFVDFDGTVAEIVADPERATPTSGVVAALERLGRRLGVVAVVSGRPAAFLASRLGGGVSLAGVRVYGLYGAEELLADGSVARVNQAGTYRRAFVETMAMARRAAPLARVEDKGDAVGLHYRERPEDEEALRAVAVGAASRFGLALRPGRMVIELAAPAAPDKGSVVRRLLHGATAAVGFGDDLGDLAAFGALDAARAARDTTVVKVAVGGSDVPAEVTVRADLVLAGPSAVAAVLGAVADELERASPDRRP